jgi:hypothetical protein
MNSERTEQGLSEELATGEASFEVCFECAKDVLNLWILHSPLINEFHVPSSVILRERLLQQGRFEIEKYSFHRFRERYRVLGAS